MRQEEQLRYIRSGSVDGILFACVELLEAILPHIVSEHSENAELLYDVREKLELIQESISRYEVSRRTDIDGGNRDAYTAHLYRTGKHSAESNLLDSICSTLALVLMVDNKASLLQSVIPEKSLRSALKNIGEDERFTPSGEPRLGWFVGAWWSSENPQDQTDRLIRDGIWENGWGEDKYRDLVCQMRPGDRIAIKKSYTRKQGLPFNNHGKFVSVMAVTAIGEVLENPGHGLSVKVDWKERFDAPREWYFFTSQHTVWRVEPTTWKRRGLLDFAFERTPQDIQRFLKVPYWGKKYVP